MHLLNSLKAILLYSLPSAFVHISKCHIWPSLYSLSLKRVCSTFYMYHINETLNRSKHQQQNLANGVVTNLGMEYVPFVTSQEAGNYVCVFQHTHTIWEMKQ